MKHRLKCFEGRQSLVVIPRSLYIRMHLHCSTQCRLSVLAAALAAWVVRAAEVEEAGVKEDEVEVAVKVVVTEDEVEVAVKVVVTEEEVEAEVEVEKVVVTENEVEVAVTKGYELEGARVGVGGAK
jgi:hypothetical protein